MSCPASDRNRQVKTPLRQVRWLFWQNHLNWMSCWSFCAIYYPRSNLIRKVRFKTEIQIRCSVDFATTANPALLTLHSDKMTRGPINHITGLFSVTMPPLQNKSVLLYQPTKPNFHHHPLRSMTPKGIIRFPWGSFLTVYSITTSILSKVFSKYRSKFDISSNSRIAK